MVFKQSTISILQKQGQQALDRSAAARGMGYSGAQMKAAQQFGQRFM